MAGVTYHHEVVLTRHIVFVRFAAGVDPAEIAGIMNDLARLKSVVPGLLAFAAGPNVSPEGLSQGFGHAFTADFESEAARDAYLIHSDHQAAGARLVRAAEGGVDGLAVMDFAL